MIIWCTLLSLIYYRHCYYVFTFSEKYFFVLFEILLQKFQLTEFTFILIFILKKKSQDGVYLNIKNYFFFFSFFSPGKSLKTKQLQVNNYGKEWEIRTQFLRVYSWIQKTPNKRNVIEKPCQQWKWNQNDWKCVPVHLSFKRVNNVVDSGMKEGIESLRWTTLRN